MVEDEPHFLGHGSGYALGAAPPLREGGDAKIIVAAMGAALDDLEHGLGGMQGLLHIIRDDVTDLIPKPGMAPPQRVDAFFHLYFETVEAARAAGEEFARQSFAACIGVYRVRTIRFV